MRSVIVLLLFLVALDLFAGGSYELVRLKSFVSINERDFVLIVEPIGRNDDYRDPYFGNCDLFTVLGKYRTIGIFEPGSIPTESEHMEAIDYLRERPKEFSFGWIGGGFHVYDTSDPCVVESRALKLMEEGHVISSYHGT